MIGAGGGAGGVTAVFRAWNWPHMPVRIFTYRVGGDAASGKTMKEMACNNKGKYLYFDQLGFKKVQVMCRETDFRKLQSRRLSF